jgi:uncharacterized membrane protein
MNVHDWETFEGWILCSLVLYLMKWIDWMQGTFMKQGSIRRSVTNA